MKNLKVSIKLVFFLLAVFIVVPTAQASAIAKDGIGLEDRHVLEAVALIYAPTPDNRSDWLDAVCQRMTEGGCGYFTDHLASGFWQNGQDVALNSVMPRPFGVAATLNDGSQVWKAEVSIYKTCNSALQNCPSIESDIYLHVVYDEVQDKWLLNRVLYGPYLEEQ
jgi:hypothetical protein